MRVLIRTSRWAIWARRLGSFALPVLIIPVFLHRSRGITSDTFAITLGVATVLALLAFLFALIAMIRLWQTGDRGWGRAVTGLIFSLICLGPMIYAGAQGLRYPMINDVTTDWDNPPAMTTANSMQRPDLAHRDEVVAAFPNAVNRTYQLDAAKVFDLASDLVSERGWEVRIRREPGSLRQTGRINASAMTLFGWRDEVGVTVTATDGGTRVTMRSRSLTGVSDLGTNGNRIEAFLLDLDARVSDWVRDNPSS